MRLEDSDIYKRLRISNPNLFDQPTTNEMVVNSLLDPQMQEGIKKRLDEVYKVSPNPESDSAILDASVVFMDMFDIDKDQAYNLAKSGLGTGLTDVRGRMNYGQALVQTGVNTFNTFASGWNMGLYMMTGKDQFKQKADEKYAKIEPLWESYGFLGDTVLSSIQPLSSSLRYMGTGFLLKGSAALVGRALSGAHPVLATVTAVLGATASMVANIGVTGISQAGNDFYNFSRMADEQGKKLDLDSPEAKALFWTSAIAHGSIEAFGAELLPGVKYLNKALSNYAKGVVLQTSFRQIIPKMALQVPVGVVGEGFEELLSNYNTALTENTLKYLANQEGASFDYVTKVDMIKEGWKAFTDGAVSMILPSIITGFIGGGAYAASMKQKASANFTMNDDSVVIPSGYVAVNKPKEQTDKADAQEKLDPIKVIIADGPRPMVVPANADEAKRAADARYNRKSDVIVAEIVEPQNLEGEDLSSLQNRAAIATGGRLSGDTIVYPDQETLDRGKALLNPLTENEGKLTFRDEDGEVVTLNVGLEEEGMEVSEPDLSYYEDPEAPHSLARMTQERALELKEREMIKEAIGDLRTHTGGRITEADLEANVDAVKLVAETLGMPTDQLLKDGVVFELVDNIPDNERAVGKISDISVDGKKHYTITLSKDATVTTLIHEMGHLLRGFATKEQMASFRKYYGSEDAAFLGDIDSRDGKFYVGDKVFDTFEEANELVKKNEEAFADDFVAYLMTGQAPTQELKNIFARMKAVLSRFIYRYGGRLSPEVKQYFDELLSGRVPQDTVQDIPTDADGNVLFQQAPPVKSDEFKRIFGDSKVVTKSGEPILVYHGSPSLFKNFNAVQLSDSGYLGAGFYFSSLKGIAETYASRTSSGYIYNAYLVMKNPLMWNEEWNGKWDEITKNILDKHPNIKKGSDEYGTLLAMELREMGYDGVLDMKGDVVNEAVVFDDNQVLLNKVEKYNLNNTLFQLAPPTDSEAFKKWFGDSKVVDENGKPLVVYHGSRQWFDAFNDGTENKHSKAPKGSIFATSSRKVAGSYYDYWGGTDPDVILEKDSPLHQNYSWGTYRKGGVYSLYMKIENPLIIDFEGKLWDEGDYDINEITKRAKSEGYDGVIAKNIRDIGFNDIPRDEYGNYQDTIATDYIAFNSTQVKATNNQGTWDAGNPNILYEEVVEKINNGSLAVLHNISANKLESADEIGGLPSPSLAITKPNIPFNQFGEITLIADPSVAIKALEEERIYDRDVWSPTVPRAEWKINQKIIDKFDAKIKAIEKETGSWIGGSETLNKSDITNGLDSIVSSYKRNIGAQLSFLKEKNIDYELKYRKPKPPFNFPLAVVEENLEYFKSTEFSTKNSEEVAEYLKPIIRKRLEEEFAELDGDNNKLIDDLTGKYTRFGYLDAVFDFAKRYEKKSVKFDEYATREAIENIIKDLAAEYESWLRDNLKEAYKDPKIKIGSKKYEYTADNILKWMRLQSERASQDTMTYGPGKAASHAGTTFLNRRGIREFEDTLISREEQEIIWEKTIKPLTESVQQDLPDYNNRYSTWESLDAIYKAIGSYIKKYGSAENVAFMRKELSAKSFTNVPRELIEQATLLAHRLATLQQDYFEAKPDRVVSLDEFVAAVVPKTLSTGHRAILTKYGIDIAEYNDLDERSEIVEKIYNNRSGNILFQLSDEAKDKLLEERKEDVRTAVEEGFWVPTKIIEEYLDETWAQEEMATREYLEQFPWMLEEAREFPTPEEYIEFINQELLKKNPDEAYKMTPQDERWHKKVFAYARIQNPDDMDAAFANSHKSRNQLIALGKTLRGYQDVGARSKVITRKRKQIANTIVYKWGAFKGVSPFVKNLSEKSSDEDIERARKLVEENPRAYRKALQVVYDAQDRVMAFKGAGDYAGQSQRDAYYDALGEEMLDALNEPLLLSEMTDREAAEFLRTSENKKDRYDARDKLATHMGVYAMELQADAEVKAAEKRQASEVKRLRTQKASLDSQVSELSSQLKTAERELRTTRSAYDKERARSWDLVEKLDEKSRKASKVGQLERDLADRRARVKELRTQLTEANRKAREASQKVESLERKIASDKQKAERDRLMKAVPIFIKVSTSMDASYYPVFGWVQERLGFTPEYSKPDAPWKKKVSMLEDYLPEEVLSLLNMGVQADQWSNEALSSLIEGMRMLQRQARIEGAYRADQTRMRRDRIALEYDRQMYGYTPMETDQSVESIMKEIRDRLDNTKQNFYNGKEGKLIKIAHIFRQSFAHIWAFSEWLDGQKENGIMFKTFARLVWEYYQEEFRNVQRRLSAFDAVREEMKYTKGRLAKKVYTYTTHGGNEVTLNLEQAITAYIYSLNEKGLTKLIHAGGNGMTHEILANIYNVLTDEDKQFAQAMIEAAGGEAEYLRLAEVFYRVYNHDLSREQNYFRFRADGVDMENDIDLAKGIRKDRFSFVEKGFGEDRTEAIYPLDLNGMRNLTKTIEEQEHLIHFGEWVRDANYLLGPHGSLGHEVRVTYGDTSYDTLLTFVKRIAGAQEQIKPIERMLNNLITQVSSSLISYNLSSMLKQAASMSYILMGDISLLHAVRMMLGWSPTPEIRDWVHAYEVMCELDPSMKERTFDIEVKRSRNLEYSTKASRALAKVRDTGIKVTTQLGDSIITVKMWWGAYLTGLDKFSHMDEAGRTREAIFYASKFIAETQSSSNPMDLAEIQTSRHTWQRLLAAFKRDAFKRWNLAFYKLPQAVRNRQWAKAGGIITSQLLGLLILAGVRGLFIKGDDDDEKHRRFLMKNLIAQLFEESLPYAGEGIATGIIGFGGGSLLEMDDVAGRWIGEVFDGDEDWEAFWKRSWELAITSISSVGVPGLAIERTVKSFDEMNFWRMIGGYWYKLGEDE